MIGECGMREIKGETTWYHKSQWVTFIINGSKLRANAWGLLKEILRGYIKIPQKGNSYLYFHILITWNENIK